MTNIETIKELTVAFFDEHKKHPLDELLKQTILMHLNRCTTCGSIDCTSTHYTART